MAVMKHIKVVNYFIVRIAGIQPMQILMPVEAKETAENGINALVSYRLIGKSPSEDISNDEGLDARMQMSIHEKWWGYS